MLRSQLRLLQIPIRYASTSGGGYPGAMRTALPRRPVKKIPLGRARPAIYHQFDVAVELTDGSVVMRRSQYPQDELRLIQDQRNNPYWNPSRDDLVDVDPNSVGNIEKFKQRYSGMFSDAADPAAESKEVENKKETKSSKPADIKKEVTSDRAPNRSSKTQDTSDLDDFLDLLDETETGNKSK
ncbi:large ribosomal subunit protein bL31m [Monosporozyma servazzii]